MGLIVKIVLLFGIKVETLKNTQFLSKKIKIFAQKPSEWQIDIFIAADKMFIRHSFNVTKGGSKDDLDKPKNGTEEDDDEDDQIL